MLNTIRDFLNTNANNSAWIDDNEINVKVDSLNFNDFLKLPVAYTGEVFIWNYSTFLYYKDGRLQSASEIQAPARFIFNRRGDMALFSDEQGCYVNEEGNRISRPKGFPVLNTSLKIVS